MQILLKETDGDTYFRVWIQLITIAMECNSEGKLVIGEKTPMTIENFSKIMGKSKKKMEKIIKKFQELNMLIIEGGAYKIKNWSKYQSVETNEKYQEQNRIRQQRYHKKSYSINDYNSNRIPFINTERNRTFKTNRSIYKLRTHWSLPFCRLFYAVIQTFAKTQNPYIPEYSKENSICINNNSVCYRTFQNSNQR